MKKIVLLVVVASAIMGMLAISGCKKKDTYTVTFNANGGTGTMEAQTFTEGEAQALTQNAFTYDGYTFTGWNTVQGGSGASYSDQQTITATADMTLYAQWTSNGTNPTPGTDPTPGTVPNKPTTGTLNGHDWVDLGLPSGTRWATCNVGANNPEGYGDYFAWGETTPKETYNWDTYRYYDGSNLTKYTGSDNLTTLEASDDAATANWGAGWRMPTKTEMNELYSNCTHEWTTQNGVNGRKFTGPNGNTIFLPAAGYRYDSELDDAGSYGYFWSSSLYSVDTGIAWYLFFYSDNFRMSGRYRYYGFTVRAVCQSQN